MADEPLSLSETRPAGEVLIGSDRRPRMFEPPPVRLMTVEDAHLPCASGRERELDEFYRDLLEFERQEGSDEFPIYRAANFRVCFDVQEPPIQREDYRLLGVEVLSLEAAEAKLNEAEIPYDVQKGINPGHRVLLLRDPAGNWLELSESRAIR